MSRSDDCASGLHNYCNLCDCECHMTLEERLFPISLKEAKALYKLLQHEFIPRDEDYEVLMRMLNGLSNFIADNEKPQDVFFK